MEHGKLISQRIIQLADLSMSFNLKSYLDCVNIEKLLSYKLI